MTWMLGVESGCDGCAVWMCVSGISNGWIGAWAVCECALIRFLARCGLTLSLVFNHAERAVAPERRREVTVDLLLSAAGVSNCESDRGPGPPIASMAMITILSPCDTREIDVCVDSWVFLGLFILLRVKTGRWTRNRERYPVHVASSAGALVP